MLHKFKNIIGLALTISSFTALAENVGINTFSSIISSATSNINSAYLKRINKHISTEYDLKYGANLRTLLNEKIEGSAIKFEVKNIDPPCIQHYPQVQHLTSAGAFSNQTIDSFNVTSITYGMIF